MKIDRSNDDDILKYFEYLESRESDSDDYSSLESESESDYSDHEVSYFKLTFYELLLLYDIFILVLRSGMFVVKKNEVHLQHCQIPSDINLKVLGHLLWYKTKRHFTMVIRFIIKKQHKKVRVHRSFSRGV